MFSRTLRHLDVDLIVDSVLHPVIFWSLVLILLYTLPTGLAKVVIVTSGVGLISKFLNDLYKRRGQWEKVGESDIALVTGGSNGLGLEISAILIQKKARVIILDREPISDRFVESAATFLQCDLSDEAKVRETIDIVKQNFGSPTILINNAAARHTEMLTDLTQSQVKKLFQVNTLSPILILQEFLNTRKRLYVVTIASILGLVSPAHLSIYSATKASLISLHDTISHEITSLNIRFLLVTPGQLNTRMFKDVNPPKQFLAPIVDSKTLARNIVDKIDLGERGTLHGPLYTYFIPLLRMLPYSLNEFARWFSEMDTSITEHKSK